MKATKAAIYASKVFQCSKRQTEIRNKIESSGNIELLQQLIGDLDEEFQTLNTVAPELNDQKDTEESDSNKTDNSVESNKPTKSPSVGQPVSFTPSSEKEEPDDNSDSEAPDQEPEDKVQEPVEESTKIHVIPLDEIKGTLNHVADTAGVSRIEMKDHELWIFYNDEVNLNNIMTEVIELLNNTGYTYLSFNRLARSNNAIVFEISYNTTMVGDVIE